MTINELYQWALEQGLENEQLYVEYVEDECNERPVEMEYIEIKESGIVL